jgi:hypothetical protein
MPRDGDVSGGGGTQRSRPQTLEVELTHLEALGAAGLRSAWEQRHGSPPPAPLPDRLLRLALGYDLQTDVHGGLSRRQEQRLTRMSLETDQSGVAKPAALRIKPGATLVRDWGGKSWRVEVDADGTFSFDSRGGRSLSAIASAITGTSRNGPAFFGLRGGASHGAA